uniref:Zona pellucida sperm-binding protein 1/4 Ig-like domain-containing protein n=1 Tax=Pygocentrus nattereri TaxID=42514 RepID=A0AAR2KD14_PYGNA
MWRNKLLLLISATLVSLAIGQESAQKADFPSEPTAPTARLGRLVVGRGVKLLSGEAEKNIGGEVRDGLTDHSETYQADQQGSTVWYKAAESKLQRLNPSVHCGDDAMALRVQGSRVPNFMVDRGEDGLLPVLQMPANCGLSVKRARRDVLLTANYKGCHVMQEDGAYILTLRLWGAPISVLCPVASTEGATNATTPGTESTVASVPQHPGLFPGYNPYGYPFNQYGYPWALPTSTVQTTTASTTTSTAPTAPASDAKMPVPFGQSSHFGYAPYRQWPYYGYPWAHPTPGPTVSPTTTASTTSTAPAVPASDAKMPGSFGQDYAFGYAPYNYWPYYKYGHPWASPTFGPTVAPTTTASTTTSTAPAVPASDAKMPVPLGQSSHFGYAPYWQWPYYKYGYPWPQPTSGPTVAPTTTASTTTSTAPTVPASDAKMPGSFGQSSHFGYAPYWQWPYYKYGYPWAIPTSGPTVAPTTTASTTTSTAPAVPANDVKMPGSFGQGYAFGYAPYNYWPYYKYGHSWAIPTSGPTVAPTTTASTTTSTAPAVPASDAKMPVSFGQMYPFGYAPCHQWPYYKYGYPWACPPHIPAVASTTTASPTSTAPNVPTWDDSVYAYYQQTLMGTP